MLVASGVEFGDDGKTVVALLPQVIGRIQTAIGCGTLTHADGIAVHVMVGDPVCQGNVIETGSDGRIEIRCIDGTVFYLFGDSRVVLREFACDSDHVESAFVVTKGSFAFIAGRGEKTGSLWVETPVGSIRGRPHAIGFGMLSLAALVFSFMKEAQAADPDVTFLDDDSITYKDFAHGAFELITKEAIPRHIIVEDPGETIVLSKIGSSVSVNPVANSPSRMEELRAAQQDVLANFAQGWAPLGSGTPDVLSPQHLLQPINFTQPDPTHLQDSLVPLEFAIFTVPEFIPPPLRPPPPPPPPPPTLEITGIGGQIGIAADNIINAAKADAGVPITGTTSGVENGRIVTVTIVDSSNQVVYSGTATVTSNTWSISVLPAEAKALADGIYTLTADVSNTAGTPAEASQSFRVDETPPTIAIDTIVSNNVVNVKAASTGFTIVGTTTDAENGQPVTVKIVDSSGQVVDTFTTTLTNNSWSVSVTSAEAKLLHDGSYTVTADVSDSAGNPAQEATQALTVDETPPTVTWLPPAEAGIEGRAIALGTITATANSLPGHSDSVQSLEVTGIPIGAVLTDGTNCFTATSGNTSVDVKSWNLSNLKIIPPNDTNFTLSVTATDQDANSANASELITVAPLPPALNPLAAHGNENTAIALDLGVMAKSLSGANGDALPNSLATLVVSDIPLGATLSDGTGLPGHSFTATAANTSFDVAGWNLSSLTITPPTEFEGCFTLKIAATDHDSEGDIGGTVTATELVTVAPVADPPTACTPATLTLNENAAWVAIAGVRVGPLAEDADDTVRATLTVSHGTLHVADLSGVTVTGDDCATLTLSGSAAAVNALLAGLTYTPHWEFEGCDTLNLSVTSSDGSNTYPTAATASTAITVKDRDDWGDGAVPALAATTFINGGSGTETSAPPVASGAITTNTTGEIAAASATANDSASASGINASLVPGNSQDFTTQVSGFTGDGTAGTPSPGQTFASSPTRSAGGNGTSQMIAAGAWADTPDNNSAANAPNIGDALTDFVMRGFGAVLLTGGNESDTSGSSSVSDSSAPRFNTIADFMSGPDKIDLTAFGSAASVILALAPTSTSVPAHTIAWLYDSKTNQTIVYVNLTDQTESICDSSLLEIHLPRVTTAHLSDFVLAQTTAAAASELSDLAVTTPSDATIAAATTADVSSDSTVSNSAFFAALTTNIGDNVDANRDDVGSINHARFVSFDEGSIDSAATTLPGGLSVQLSQLAVTAPMQTIFASDQKPVTDSADTTTIDHGASMHGPTVDSGGGIVPSGSDWEVNTKSSSNGDHGALIPDNADGSHPQELDTYPIVTLDPRFVKALENSRGDRWIASDASEHALHEPGAHDYEPSYLTQIMSGGNVGPLGDSFHFKGDNSDSRGSGVIGVAERNDVPVSMHDHLEATGTHGPLSISRGEVTPSTLGDSFHFKEISGFEGTGVNNFTEPDQIPTSITHNENAAVPHGPPPISAPQTIEMPLPGPQSDDHSDVVLHHPQSHFVTHDLIV
jgi:Bacterial Ig-like domain/FecR protein/Peptidase M10 serralysin C terminal